MSEPLFTPGALWSRVLTVTENAQANGALHSIATKSLMLEHTGIRFLVRVLTRIEHKEKARKIQNAKSAVAGKAVNPFLPYEKDLFVVDISATHVALLNKFNVVPHHLLIVTRAYEEQETPLKLADFEALWACMSEYPALGFYNGGIIAGASQRHKHLQMVPLPFSNSDPKIPIEPLINRAQYHAGIGTVPAFNFKHALAHIDPGWIVSTPEAARKTLSLYNDMCVRVGLKREAIANNVERLAPYNLIITQEWMLLVPRSEEFFEGISFNALGFAGALLVRNEAHFNRLREIGPLTVLSKVAISL